MVKPLGEAEEMVKKVQAFKPLVKGLKDIKDSDLGLINLEFDQEE